MNLHDQRKAPNPSRLEARTSLARQRTGAAWQRTGLMIAAIGIGSTRLLDRSTSRGVPLGRVDAILMISCGMLALGIGRLRFRRRRMLPQSASDRSAATSVTALTGLVIVVGGVALDYVLHH